MTHFPDRNPKRIFLGGITNGASIALATYLKYNKATPLGGVVSLYGINPLTDQNIPKSPQLDSVRSKIPMLMFNNKYLLNDLDVKYTIKWFSDSFYDAGKSPLFSYHDTIKLGSYTSNMKHDFNYKHSKDYPTTMGR